MWSGMALAPSMAPSAGPNHLLHRATPFSDFVKLSALRHGAGWRMEPGAATSGDKGITTGYV